MPFKVDIPRHSIPAAFKAISKQLLYKKIAIRHNSRRDIRLLYRKLLASPAACQYNDKQRKREP
ncbi:hypothetical protein D3C77_747380 [compost metagenome]